MKIATAANTVEDFCYGAGIGLTRVEPMDAEIKQASRQQDEIIRINNGYGGASCAGT